MVDLGLDKLALIGAVALIVIGPERLPKVARTVGHLLGKARRYVADVKAEVNRSMEMEELNKVKQQFQDAAADVGNSIQSTVNEAQAGLTGTWESDNTWGNVSTPFKPVRKNWRVKRGNMPMWFKQRQGVKRQIQSGAARVARFRPKSK
jgi:sec-independent protein translocase protein TatB